MKRKIHVVESSIWKNLAKYITSYIGCLPDGRPFNGICIGSLKSNHYRIKVTAVGEGYKRDEEGSKVIWKELEPSQQFEVTI